MARLHLLLTGALCALIILFTTQSLRSNQTGLSALYSARTPPPKNAYCVFLAEPNDLIKPGQEDVYFTGVRMLAYQLLHDPYTRTSRQTPNAFVVMVAPEVTQEKRRQLERDGAIVKEIEHTHFDWIKPGRIRWAQVMDKLAVFKLIEYEKVLLLDTDMVVTRPMDAVFDDPATVMGYNHGDKAKTKDDEGEQPMQYIMAGNHQGRMERLNAGFVVLRPSMEMYEHHMRVAGIEGRFPGGSPEQDLWNYVHRRDGNMPWTQLNETWTVNSPKYEDYERGVVALHEKYWRCRDDPRLRDVLLRSRWKMEGFFESYHGNQQILS